VGAASGVGCGEWDAPVRGRGDGPEFGWRRLLGSAGLPYTAPLVFFVFPLGSVLTSGLDGWALVLALALVATLAGLFVGTAIAARADLASRIAYLTVFLVVVLASTPLVGIAALNSAMFLTVMIALLLPAVLAVPVGLGWGAIVVVAGLVCDDTTAVLLGALGAAVGVSISLGLRVARAQAQLAATRLELEQAIVRAERERIARDLHDVLGHSLTAIAITADLVERLVTRDPQRALEQVREVTSIARAALAELRDTTTGLRQVSVQSELASARAVLAAAEIEARLPSGEMPRQPDDEVLGYVIREAVTNVVRHSGADWCEVQVGPGWVLVTDNGCGTTSAGAQGAGSGLAGLAARVGEAAGSLSMRPRPAGGTEVEARLPAAAGSPPPRVAALAADSGVGVRARR
jgi:two-component system sensor histidine kinase DesK